MSVLTDLESQFGKDTQEMAGIELAMAREVFKEELHNPVSSEQSYSHTATTYLNALQRVHFESPSNMHSANNNASRILKVEAELLLGSSIECMEDIQERFNAYLTDEVADRLKLQQISRAPRAFTLTLLDLLDCYRKTST